MKERPDTHLIQTVLLRSLRQAVYSPDNIGHFGLAFDAYAHFTSPIRRYPDLVVHRAIRHLLSGKPVDTFQYDHERMIGLGEHCSQNERRADEATRDAIDWLKCEYMLDKVGEEFEGTISSVTSFGLFVELDEIYVEGLIHVTGLANDYFQFDPVKHRMLGERTRQSYRLGDRLRIRVARVDLDERKIDFDLVQVGQPTRQRRVEAEQEVPRRRRGRTVTKKKAAKKKTGKHKTSKEKDEPKQRSRKKTAKKKMTGKKASKQQGTRKKGKKKSKNK